MLGNNEAKDDSKKTMVIGASDNPARYSYLAITMLREKGHPVIAIGNRKGQVRDVSFSKERPKETVDTVTLYLNSTNQKEYYDYLLSLQPHRIIFNPGAENPELKRIAEEKGIRCLEACTLVLLSTGQY